MPPVDIRELTFEHYAHETSVHVNTPAPRLSWKLIADIDARNIFQISYEVEIAANVKNGHEGKAVSYESQSGDSVLVPWPGESLVPRERCLVRIRSTWKIDNRDETTAWTDWYTIQCALLNRSDFTANFITSSAKLKQDDSLRPLRFRKLFSLPEDKGQVARAHLYITAHGVYEATINGHRVGDHEMAPGWTSYKHRLSYQIFNVTDSIQQKNTNVIGVEVAEGWYAGRLGWDGHKYLYGTQLAVFAQLEIGFDNDPAIFSVTSDNTWQCDLSLIVSSQIYDGEVYDAEQDLCGWSTNSAVDTSSWVSAIEIEFPTSKLVAIGAPPVRVTQKVSPIKIFESKSGRKILDFGQNLVGKLYAPVIDKSEGHVITFTYAEVMENDEIGTRPLRSAKSTDTIYCGKVLREWSPKFTFHGFRYVEVTGWDDINQDSVVALVMHTDMQRTGWFNCSEPLVNKLHENTVWSMRGNFLSIPTDCPQRDERLGWTGDIQVFGPSANFLYDTSAMLGHWLEDLAAEQGEHDGVPPFVVPDVLHKQWGSFPQAVWDDVTILLPWALYKAFGDTDILRDQYLSMQAWVDTGLRRGPDGLWDRNTWQLGDWLDPIAPPERPGLGRTDGTYVADAYLVHVTNVMIKISKIIGEDAHAVRYAAQYESYKDLFNQKYITPAGLVAADSQTGLALSIVFGLHEKHEQVKVAAEQLCRAVRLARFQVATGFAGTPIITHALSTTGLSQYAYSMLLEKSCPSWLYPITMGATTIWERWDSMLPDGKINPGSMTSFNHYALGSVVNWLHEVVGGISPIEAGWKRFKVRPVPGGTLTWAEVSHESPYGMIRCRWEIEGTVFKLDVDVPPNTNAVVIMPDKQVNVIFGEKEEGMVVGSGSHTFSCRYEAKEWPPKAIYPGMMQIKD